MGIEGLISLFMLFMYIFGIIAAHALKEEDTGISILLNTLVLMFFIMNIALLSNSYEAKKDMIKVISENNLSTKLKNEDAKKFTKKYLLDKYYKIKKKEIEKEIK
jgi:putative effector of murein hydrolase LrgA (UPF0299 family)